MSVNIVLCGSNAYEKKYYLNPEYNGIPEEVKKELKMLCVSFTEEIGGILTLEFKPNGTLIFRVEVAENDFAFDEIGSELRIKQMQTMRGELLRSMELYHKIVCSAKMDDERNSI